MEERPSAGEQLNQLKRDLEGWLDARLAAVKAESKRELSKNRKSISRSREPLRARRHSHPLTLVIDEIIDIFYGLGFEIARGPDIEDDYHNFEALNFPKDHPARDMQDTFFVSNDRLLRTHTSPVQIRTMENRQPPLQVIVPGAVTVTMTTPRIRRCFIRSKDSWSTSTYSFADLKGVLTHVLRADFQRDAGVRFRPSFFPFTEPSAEIDIQCVICGGSGSMNRSELPGL